MKVRIRRLVNSCPPLTSNNHPDQSFGSERIVQEQEQRHSPSFHRCQLRLESHFVRSSKLHATNTLITLSRSGASLTLAHGRRYGIIGRNGMITLRHHLLLQTHIMLSRCRKVYPSQTHCYARSPYSSTHHNPLR